MPDVNPHTDPVDPRTKASCNLEEIFKGFKLHRLVCGSSVGLGWKPLLEGFVAGCGQPLIDRTTIMQVKEKFGGLRLYISVDEEGLDPVRYQELADQAQSLRRSAEDLSYKTCEWCGKLGSSGTDGGFWTLTLCGGCKDERRHFEKHRFSKTSTG
jgi:hypothetical protein